MLHVKDLMVEDWVKTPYDISKIETIYGAAERIQTSSLIELPIDEIESIPLTTEILEKNGFTRSNEHVRYFTEATDYYDVDIHEITDSIWCFKYQNCEIHFPSYLIFIGHVHELQHVLRLCGIEKEIEL